MPDTKILKNSLGENLKFYTFSKWLDIYFLLYLVDSHGFTPGFPDYLRLEFGRGSHLSWDSPVADHKRPVHITPALALTMTLYQNVA